MEPLVLEGAWEEIARESERLSGKRVRLIVLSNGEERPGTRGASLLENGTPEQVIRALDALADQNRHLPVPPPEALERESLYGVID